MYYRYQQCKACNGKGVVMSENVKYTCPHCHGFIIIAEKVIPTYKDN